jgi:glycosyltransferase involved in cell wall biosynthesis
VTVPAISVVMAVYNCEPWIAEAVASVTAQTFADFELIVVDDGSTDQTAATLARCKDPRLSVVRQPRAGQTPALNRALRMARAPLLARMDGDDVALPERLARQAEFLDAHPEVGLLGTGGHEIEAAGAIVSTVIPPGEDKAIRRTLIRRNPFIHSSVMMRRAVLDKVGLYNERFVVAQDYDLWLRMSRVTRMANIPEPLVLRRLAPGQLSSARDSTRLGDDVTVKLRALRGGDYPLWCAVFLAKPLVGLALPVAVRRLLRPGARRS